MNYAAEIGSDDLIYMPSFIKIGSTIQKTMERGTCTDTHTYTQIEQGDFISLFLFLKIRKIG
jgi:hypothetical protein